MADFALPHDHGRHKHDEALHRELMNTERFSAVADVFKQLSDPVRVRIFWLLSHREECVINIAAMMDMSSPAVSHHLKSLLDSGLIMSRRDGKEVYYKASDTEQIRAFARDCGAGDGDHVPGKGSGLSGFAGGGHSERAQFT